MCEHESSICEVCFSEGFDGEDTDSKYSCSATCMPLMHVTVLGGCTVSRVLEPSTVQVNQVHIQVTVQHLGVSNTRVKCDVVVLLGPIGCVQSCPVLYYCS